MLWKIQQRLLQLDRLINQKSTGTPKELAKKLKLSERGWYKLRDELVNDLKIPIEFDSDQKCYVYKEPGHIIMGFRKLEEVELTEKNGGRGFIYSMIPIHYFINNKVYNTV